MRWTHAALAFVFACGPHAPATEVATAPEALAPSRVAMVRELSCADLELVVPFYEGLRFTNAPAALRAVKSEYLELAYPGALSMPLVAYRCGSEPWTAITTTTPTTSPASLLVRTHDDDVTVRLECFGPCTFREIHAAGPWTELAKEASHAMDLRPSNPPLSSKWDAMHFFVRNWVSKTDDPALRTDFGRDALAAKLASEKKSTIDFVFGLDPNEVDLEGKYFWSEGATDEMRALVRASPAAQLHWLNLRSYKVGIPRLGIVREPPPEILAAAKRTKRGVEKFSQYVFDAIEMCIASEAWQASRIAEMKKLLDLGFRVVALDEFPTATTWSAEPCRAANHMHRPGDFADIQRHEMELVKRLYEMAHARGVMLSSEEPSLELLPFTSGYMDGAFSEPAEMYEHWQSSGIERIPLFSSMVAITPYTRIAKSHHVPRGWWVQEDMHP